MYPDNVPPVLDAYELLEPVPDNEMVYRSSPDAFSSYMPPTTPSFSFPDTPSPISYSNFAPDQPILLDDAHTFISPALAPPPTLPERCLSFCSPLPEHSTGSSFREGSPNPGRYLEGGQGQSQASSPTRAPYTVSSTGGNSIPLSFLPFSEPGPYSRMNNALPGDNAHHRITSMDFSSPLLGNNELRSPHPAFTPGVSYPASSPSYERNANIIPVVTPELHLDDSSLSHCAFLNRSTTPYNRLHTPSLDFKYLPGPHNRTKKFDTIDRPPIATPLMAPRPLMAQSKPAILRHSFEHQPTSPACSQTPVSPPQRIAFAPAPGVYLSPLRGDAPSE
jgi:hypothetical protein